MKFKNKYLLALSLLALIHVSCTGKNDKTKSLELRIDSLRTKLNSSYTPGFGEIMGTVQVHHAKLWFAGKYQNWDLSNYELGEIREALDNIQKYETARTESKLVPMIFPALDGVSSAITNKNVVEFEKAFRTLTNTCNSCHLAAKHEYNVITIPQNPPFTNQLFKK
ncbi:MAG: hypothetical protein NTX65_09515 [Ignavibacteriales bacterium]|nr:hypothetical protein [Ignavibacteriales bacterium]